MIWVLPLTSKEKKNPYYIKITHDAGVSWVSLTQIKAISTKRLLRKVGMISIEEFLLIGKSITGYITIEPRSEAGFSEAEATNNSIVASVVNQSNDEIKKL